MEKLVALTLPNIEWSDWNKIFEDGILPRYDVVKMILDSKMAPPVGTTSIIIKYAPLQQKEHARKLIELFKSYGDYLSHNIYIQTVLTVTHNELNRYRYPATASFMEILQDLGERLDMLREAFPTISGDPQIAEFKNDLDFYFARDITGYSVNKLNQIYQVIKQHA